MNSSFTHTLKITTSDVFQKSLSDYPYYFFFSGTKPWKNESSPPTPENHASQIISSVGDVIGLKRICQSNLQSVIPKYEWQEGLVFSQYHDNKDYSEGIYYALVNGVDVYKCISNGNYLESKLPPHGYSKEPIKLDDGYIWVYMYSLTESDVETYKAINFIPCYDNTYISQDGTIDRVDVICGGKNYNQYTTKIVVSGDGTGCKLVPEIINGEIVKINVVNRGSLYRNASITVIDDNMIGSGATIKAVISTIGGHGSNPKEELHASQKLVSVILNGTENDIFPSNIKYRKIGVLTKALSNDKGQIIRLACTKNLKRNQIIIDNKSGTKGLIRLVNYDENIVYVQPENGNFNINSYIEISGKEDRYKYRILNISETDHLPLSSDIVNGKDYMQYSGKLLWFNYIRPVERQDNKIEEYKFIVSF